MHVPVGWPRPLVDPELDDRIVAPIPKVAEWFKTAHSFPSDVDALKYLLFTPAELPVKDGKDLYTSVLWIPGGRWDISPQRGPLRHHRVMAVSKMPGSEEKQLKANFVGQSGKFLRQICNEVGIDSSDWYMTNVVRFPPPDGGKSLKREYIKECEWLLRNEIALVKPQFLLLLGADAVKAVCGRAATLSKMRSHYFMFQDASEIGVKPPTPIDEADIFKLQYGIKVMATIHPVAVLKEGGLREGFVRDMDLFQGWLINRPLDGVDIEEADYRYCHDVSELTKNVDEVLNGPYTDLAVDCEWIGKDHRSGTLRSVQFSWKEGTAAVAVLSDSLGRFDAAHLMAMTKELIRLVRHPKIKIIGHNMRADARWLEYRGIHVMDKLAFDTMLADHMLNENAEHGLDACTVRYTSMGRYDTALNQYLEKNRMTAKHLKANGFKFIPDDILLPYGACDADATLRVAHTLRKRLRDDPKLEWCFNEIVMPTNFPIHEIEMSGFLIDTDRMQELTVAFAEKKRELLARIHKELGRPEFNPRSAQQMQKLLFGAPADGNLGLQPYKTTGKPSRMWAELKEYELRRHTPSTDAETLEALSDAHPIVSLLRDFKLVDQVTKSFLREAEEHEETAERFFSGGLMAELDDDGRIRTTISQMSETGRWKSSRPNLQNLPKRQDKELGRIMGDINTIRSCFIAPRGHVLVEADYKSAEIFTLGRLANCAKLLQDAQGDLHARGAVTRFGAEKWDGFDEFKPPPADWLKKYKALRVCSKTITFGIPYQRGAAAIARQIVKDTKGGVPCDVFRAKDMIQGFYAEYPEIRDYVEMCQRAVVAPGWLNNPYHRRRRFMAHDTEALLAAQQREAVNFPIQSTVADTLNVAVQNLYWWRELNPGRAVYEIILAIHDAAMLLVPVEYLEVVTSEVLPQCLKEAAVVPSWQPTDKWKPTEPFTLDIDIEMGLRWGEDATAEELKLHGASDAVIEKFAK